MKLSDEIAEDHRKAREQVTIASVKAQSRESAYTPRVVVPKSATDPAKWLRAKASPRKPASLVAHAVAFERMGRREPPSWTKPKPSLAALLESVGGSLPGRTGDSKSPGSGSTPDPLATPRLIVKHGDESTPVDFKRAQEYDTLADGYSQFNLARHYNIAWARLSRLSDGKVLLEYGFSGRYEKRTPWRQIRIPRQFSAPRKRR